MGVGVISGRGGELVSGGRWGWEVPGFRSRLGLGLGGADERMGLGMKREVFLVSEAVKLHRGIISRVLQALSWMNIMQLWTMRGSMRPMLRTPCLALDLCTISGVSSRSRLSFQIVQAPDRIYHVQKPRSFGP